MINFNYQQDNLELMSKDRKQVTDEIHCENDYYGQANILRKYCNYSRPIKVVYEHSLPVTEIIWDIDKKSIFPIAFVSSKHRYNLYKKQKAKSFVFNVGSILNYAIDISHKEKGINDTERKGSIYFPSHSTHHIKSTNNSDEIIERLLNLPEIYQPVYVCIYWKDIQYGNHLNYQKHGIPVVCAGHIYDNLFYFRLYDILKNFKYTLGSAFGSFVFHAARSGSLVVFPNDLVGLKDNYAINSENFQDKDFINRMEFVKKFDKTTSEMFSMHIEKYSDEQKEFIEYYCGSALYSPRTIKLILFVAEPIYYLSTAANFASRVVKYFFRKLKINL